MQMGHERMDDRMNVDPLKAEYFYKNVDEKIKLNWFCYEYAFSLYAKIKSSTNLTKYKNRHTQDQITAFCVHFSKAMKQSIFDKLSGRTPVTIMDDDYVYTFYPKNTPAQTKALLAAAGDAWDELLSICEGCPTRCISEMYEKCDMFDRLKEDGYLF
jgi:hypothetical protein